MWRTGVHVIEERARRLEDYILEEHIRVDLRNIEPGESTVFVYLVHLDGIFT